MVRPRSALALVVAMMASACTPDGEFPSLAPRAIEQQDPLAEPVRTPPVVPSDPAVRARAAELLAEARRGEAEFAAAYALARGAAAPSGDAGSESWIEAQQALSRAEAARAPTTAALAELDRLLVERAALPTAASDLAALQEALAEIERLSRAQQERLDSVRRSIGR
jgi:flagellar motility protein MotE (MotC chaperone)